MFFSKTTFSSGLNNGKEDRFKQRQDRFRHRKDRRIVPKFEFIKIHKYYKTFGGYDLFFYLRKLFFNVNS